MTRAVGGAVWWLHPPGEDSSSSSRSSALVTRPLTHMAASRSQPQSAAGPSVSMASQSREQVCVTQGSSVGAELGGSVGVAVGAELGGSVGVAVGDSVVRSVGVAVGVPVVGGEVGGAEQRQIPRPVQIRVEISLTDCEQTPAPLTRSARQLQCE